MAGADDLDGFDDFGGLEAWAAEARAREAAESRVRERWLRTQAEEGAGFTGVLSGLVERGGTVTLMTIGGRALAGRLTAVGADFVALTLPGGRRTLVTLNALAWVQAAPGTRRAGDAALGDRELDEDATAAAALVDVLAQAAANRPRVAVQTAGAGITGELRSVGVDVLALQLATAGDQPSGPSAPSRALAYVQLRSVYEISFLDSG